LWDSVAAPDYEDAMAEGQARRTGPTRRIVGGYVKDRVPGRGDNEPALLQGASS
jgi:hypothetical protein